MILQKSSSGNKNLPWFVLFIPLSIMAVGQTAAKLAGNRIEEGGSMVNIYTFISYACLLIRGGVWIAVMRRIRLVFAYPFLSLNYIIILIISG